MSGQKPQSGASWYAQQLKDPRWQKRRLEILNRDKWTCQECGATDRTLHVHHAVYAKGKAPWEAEDFHLETLCETCHEKLSAVIAYIREGVGLLKLEEAHFVLGFLTAHALHRTMGGSARVAGAAEANGVARYFGISRRDVEAASGPDGKVSFDALWDAHAGREGQS